MQNTLQGPCKVCGDVGQACSRCYLDFYCNVHHQKADWPRHQAGCEALELRGGWVFAAKDIPAGTKLLKHQELSLGRGDHPVTGIVVCFVVYYHQQKKPPPPSFPRRFAEEGVCEIHCSLARCLLVALGTVCLGGSNMATLVGFCPCEGSFAP